MERLSKISLAFSVALLGLFIIYGCTGDANPPGDPTGGDVASDAVGLTECLGCHAEGANPTGTIVFGDSDAALANGNGWLRGPHGNNETFNWTTYVQEDLSPSNLGFPYFGYEGLGEIPECSAKCHDPLGDGKLLADFASNTGVDSLGAVDRPVVGCESCHGSGAGHSGIGPIADSTPGPDKCGQCHNEEFDHNKYHPEGDSIYEDYSASVHSGSRNAPYVLNGEEAEGLCSKCHTDEGAKAYKDIQGGHDYLESLSLANIADASSIQCRTCHDAHNPSKLLFEDTTDGLGNVVSSGEYDTCTNCHQAGDGYHGELDENSWGPQGDPPSVGVGNFDSSGIIYDTHFDNATTPWIEGYVLDTAGDRVCRGCHNPHSADTTVNEQWAKSAHAGHILEVKEAAFANTTDDLAEALAILNGAHSYGSVTEDDGPAWVHYDFKTRSSCARCHTSTGFRNFANDPLGYAPANNVFTATGQQREMLYCWACHTDNAGGLRDSYPFVNTSPYTEPSGRIANVGDLGGSNICAACHSGRASGAVIAGKSPAIFNNTSFTNSHYLAAGGTLFRTIGYEHRPASDYDNVSYFLHDRIGTSYIPSTGDNGPCAGCHMRSEEGHTFEPVMHDGLGAISNITSYNETCSVCHGDKAGLVGSLNSLRDGYEAALDVLGEELGNNGFVFATAHPYFYNATGYDPNYDEDTANPHCQKNLPVKNWQTGGASTFTWDAVDEECASSVLVEGAAGTGPANMGAAFNFNMLKHEPGAYVHNGRYAKRLIFDSLDWLDNGTLDGTIAIANAAAAEYLGLSRP